MNCENYTKECDTATICPCMLYDKKSVNIKIQIDQNVPSIISGIPEYCPDMNREMYTRVSNVILVSKRYTQIGKYPNYVKGREVNLLPTGLEISPFIKENDKDAYSAFIKRINAFIRNDFKKIYEEALKIDDINAIQIIKITKI